MSHPLVLGLYESAAAAAAGAQAVRALGIDREQLSIVAKSHVEEGRLARRLGGTPGADIEDSRVAARLGELGGHILAAIAVVMPGIGPIVTAGPLAAELGEVAGHAAGSIASVLERTGVDGDRAGKWAHRVEGGGVLLGVHTTPATAEAVRGALATAGALETEIGRWEP